MVTYAAADRVERAELEEFVRPLHHHTLITRRRDGGLQVSPVAGGLDDHGRIVVSTYPSRAKVANLRRDPTVTVLVHGEDWDDPYVQLDGTAEVLDLPEAEDALVDYYRCIAGEHPDWDEYRAAMRRQGKCLIRITIDRWGPIARGGFPPPSDG